MFTTLRSRPVLSGILTVAAVILAFFFVHNAGDLDPRLEILLGANGVFDFIVLAFMVVLLILLRASKL